MLSTANQKLSPKWLGPFKIVKQINKVTFKLDLQGKLQVHLVFHTSLLRPYEANDDAKFPGRKQLTPPPVYINGQEEYEVEAITNK